MVLNAAAAETLTGLTARLQDIDARKAALEREQEQLRSVISGLRSLFPDLSEEVVEPETTSGLTASAAILTSLRESGIWMSPRAVLERSQSLGWVTSSTMPINVVRNTLGALNKEGRWSIQRRETESGVEYRIQRTPEIDEAPAM